MSRRSSEAGGRLTTHPTVRYLFYGLLALLFGVGAGHLYLIDGRTALYLGLPAWIWLQLVVVAVMLAIAWLAVGLRTAATGGGSR